MSFTWPGPDILPRPDQSLTNKVAGNVIRTQMDAGQFRQRRRFTSALRSIQVAWEFSDDEYALFQGIWKYKITEGADWFNMELPFGSGLNSYLVRFTDAGFSESYESGMFHKVTASLETEDDISILTSEEVDALLS